MTYTIGYTTPTSEEEYWAKTPSLTGILAEMNFPQDDRPFWFKWKGTTFCWAQYQDGVHYIVGVETGNIYHLSEDNPKYWETPDD